MPGKHPVHSAISLALKPCFKSNIIGDPANWNPNICSSHLTITWHSLYYNFLMFILIFSLGFSFYVLLSYSCIGLYLVVVRTLWLIALNPVPHTYKVCALPLTHFPGLCFIICFFFLLVPLPRAIGTCSFLSLGIYLLFPFEHLL